MTQTTPSAESNRGEDSVDVAAESGGGAIHLPSLLVAVAIMLGGSVYPLLFVGTDGEADHGLAMALFWAMSAGFVRGVGFLPRAMAARRVSGASRTASRQACAGTWFLSAHMNTPLKISVIGAGFGALSSVRYSAPRAGATSARL